jgi:hypothetical protein
VLQAAMKLADKGGIEALSICRPGNEVRSGCATPMPCFEAFGKAAFRRT